jgi:NAD(P)-dependent dehydrogenase (short-subunit alcohol dehydrogenase family)
VAYAAFDLAGKTALVTGGNGGIGLGMATALAQAGADLAIWGRDEAKLRDAGSALAACGVRVRCEAVDVSDPDAVAAAMTALAGDFGRIDAVFANAGISGRIRFTDLDPASYRRILSTNLDGVVWTLQEAARHMAGRAEAGDPGGSLVTVSSVSAITGAPRLEAYAASKGALISLSKALAVEFGRHGVRVNTIIPGWIKTGMTAKSYERPEVADAILGRVPARRWGSPRDLGGIAVYLASDASAYHSGDVIVIDGGYTTA